MTAYTLTGRGVQQLSASVTRIFVTVTAFPPNLKFGSAEPTNYYHLGLIRPGVNGFYQPPVSIEGLDCFFDLPSGVTQFGYNLAPGTTINVSENTSPALAIATSTPVTNTTVSHVGFKVTGTSSDVFPTAGTGYFVAVDYGYAATLGGSTTYVSTLSAQTLNSDGTWTAQFLGSEFAGHSFWNFFPFVTTDGSTHYLDSNSTKVQIT